MTARIAIFASLLGLAVLCAVVNRYNPLANIQNIQQQPKYAHYRDRINSTNHTLGTKIKDQIKEHVKHNSANKTQHLPQAIVIGAKKCGTSTLRFFMSHHPQVAFALPEIHFFDFEPHYVKGIEWYRTRMVFATDQQVTMEKSPKYFIDPQCPQRIHSWNPNIKLILTLRDPVNRLVSDYFFLISYSKMDLPPFEDVVFGPDGNVNVTWPPVDVGIYHKHYKRWISQFPKSQLHIIDGENLTRNPADELHKVEEFLEIPHWLTKDRFVYDAAKGFYCLNLHGESKCLGRSFGHKHQAIPSANVLAKVHQFYEPHNEIFYEMAGRNFNWTRYR